MRAQKARWRNHLPKAKERGAKALARLRCSMTCHRMTSGFTRYFVMAVDAVCDCALAPGRP
jgi:hypothetical protein